MKKISLHVLSTLVMTKKSVLLNGAVAVVVSLLTIGSASATTIPSSQIPNNPNAAPTTQQQAAAQKKESSAKWQDYHNQLLESQLNSSPSSSNILPNANTYNYYALGVQTIIENPDWNCGPAATLQDANFTDPTNP